MPRKRKASVERRATYVTLSGIFFTLFAVFNLIQGRRRQETEIKPLDLAMLGLSSYRLGRLIAYDKVTEPYRRPFTKTVPDSSGAGDTVEPRGKGWRRAVGELISCPICAGTWVSAGLVYGLGLFPRPTRVLMTIMSGIGLGELLGALTEELCWVGQLAREQAGAINRKSGLAGLQAHPCVDEVVSPQPGSQAVFQD